MQKHIHSLKLAGLTLAGTLEGNKCYLKVQTSLFTKLHPVLYLFYLYRTNGHRKGSIDDTLLNL